MTLSDTKERLLDSGEELFADLGFADTSLRDITAAAGANLASVNYHFGGKEGLLQAIFDRRLAPVNARRLELLDAFENAARPAPVELEHILWAFLAPPFRGLAEAEDGARHFLRIVGRMHSDPARWGGFFERQFGPIAERFHAAFSASLPHLEPAEVLRRMHYLIGAMAHTFCWCERMCAMPVEPENDWRVPLESLVVFTAAGMRAPARPLDVREPLTTPTGAERR